MILQPMFIFLQKCIPYPVISHSYMLHSSHILQDSTHMATLAITSTSSTCSTKTLTVFSQSTPQPPASRRARETWAVSPSCVLPDPNDYRAVQCLLGPSLWKGRLQLCCQFLSSCPSYRIMSLYCLLKLK